MSAGVESQSALHTHSLLGAGHPERDELAQEVHARPWEASATTPSHSSGPRVRSMVGLARLSLSRSDTFLECLLSQRVDASTLSLRLNGQPFMQFGRDTQVELA